jgi:hypothetical protein
VPPPIWLLDVDGVINVNKPRWHAAPRRAFAYDNGTTWTIRWAPRLIDRIRDLHTSGVAEVRWCSTWCAQADQLERIFRLPPLGRAFTEELRGVACSVAKLAAAREVLADGRRLIWTDDVEVPTEHSDPELYAELTADGRGLLIRPDDRGGLTPDELDRIEAFATAAADVTTTTEDC